MTPNDWLLQTAKKYCVHMFVRDNTFNLCVVAKNNMGPAIVNVTSDSFHQAIQGAAQTLAFMEQRGWRVVEGEIKLNGE